MYYQCPIGFVLSIQIELIYKPMKECVCYKNSL